MTAVSFSSAVIFKVVFCECYCYYHLRLDPVDYVMCNDCIDLLHHSESIVPCRLGEGGDIALVRHDGRGSEGFLEHIFKHAAKELFGLDVHEITYKTLR